MINYKDMSEILIDEEYDAYRIEKFTIGDGDIRALMSGIPKGNYVRLIGPGGTFGPQVLMSNTPMEKRTNATFIAKANGNVLIGGLGIGLIVLPLLEKENIKSITIIEKSPEIIEMVGAQLKLPEDKVKIIEGDVFTYEPEQKFDTIYMDIWPWVNSDIYEEQMKPLKQRYRKWLVSKKDNPDRYIACWAEYEAKNNMRLM